ncbi:lipase maturation factor family protein [Flavitalea sp. BT771]|uniref:lipase maturation factor family protein n=1 Tax=Flavitalea sp. BT771 TaxID=3063329 RepID=UPI0026E47CB4|nr:lipase maturation factor family protein [Flavitalea sp. BT771]MDO6435654.1 lipase maturation factor family protein [Flavitalea sp. BT771]MDV6224555.1 lipase maturation factor family protein [Flavitalea sp. BT771]
MDARPSYWLTRFLILRLLGAVYAIAFLVAINQVIPLIGHNGLTPANLFIKRYSDIIGPTASFIRLPSIFWINHSDAMLLATAWIGFVLSCVVLAGFANAPLMTVLWFLYMSFVNIGQEWYGYGWEIQLLETGFLAIFLCPLIDMRPFPKQAPPMPIITLFRWLIFRIMLGAGLIKIRGDDVWRNWTALYYHFETQPIPGPLSRWFHFLPRWILRSGVLFNHLAELVAPWFVFWPRLARHIAGSIIICLQVFLIFSGNLSFLNWLTIIPALACFDDAFWAKLLPRPLVQRARIANDQAEPSRPMRITAWVVTVVIAFLSIQPALNMLSPNQIMITSYDPLNLVNTYGAFGSVGRERYNVIFEGTNDSLANDKTIWIPYPYKGLPVALDQRPPQIAPYQLRLDWQMWFAAMSTPDEYPWTITLVSKLLHNDPDALSLFAANPFPGKPPHYIRAVLYRYTFAPTNDPAHLYWHRRQIGDTWLPAMAKEDPRLTGSTSPYPSAVSIAPYSRSLPSSKHTFRLLLSSRR